MKSLISPQPFGSTVDQRPIHKKDLLVSCADHWRTQIRFLEEWRYCFWNQRSHL